MRLLPTLSKTASPPPTKWRKKPAIYEINTWVWLRHLSQKYNRPITLANVPGPVIADLSAHHLDAVWLMGVWHRGPATRRSALNYMHEYRQVLPDVSEADVPGSAYAIRDYRVEPLIGGRSGLARFRQQLQASGIKLILDYVPNHTATDHAWLYYHPEYFVQGTPDEAARLPSDFFRAETADGKQAVIARGRDPYFPSWIDTAQLNAFSSGLRQAAADTLIDIASQCDGVRCDMAMLMMNDIFAQTWGARAGRTPASDFWTEIIPRVRQSCPNTLFIAEVYWDLEHKLLQQGFDYTYDKRLYDRLVNQEIGAIKAHLSADLSYLQSNIRFIENHDEPRAMSRFGAAHQRPAAVLICTLPGAALLHQGQFEGRRAKLPVQINRQPAEPLNPLLAKFYKTLLQEAHHPIYELGNWRLLEVQPAFAGSHTAHSLIAYTWDTRAEYRLIVLNLSREWAQGILHFRHWHELSAQDWRLYDVLNASYSQHHGPDILEKGLLLRVPPGGAHIFRFDRHLPPPPGDIPF